MKSYLHLVFIFLGLVSLPIAAISQEDSGNTDRGESSANQPHRLNLHHQPNQHQPNQPNQPNQLKQLNRHELHQLQESHSHSNNKNKIDEASPLEHHLGKD